MLINQDNKYQIIHSYFIPPIIRWSGDFRGTGRQARSLLKERLSVWRTDHKALIPPADLRVIRNHWSSAELDDLRGDATALFHASLRAWKTKIAFICVLVSGIICALSYFSYPYLRYQNMARDGIGRLLIEVPVKTVTLELFRIDEQTGALAPMPAQASQSFELPAGGYYLRAKFPGGATVFERYPIVVTTIRYLDDIKRIALSEKDFARISPSNMSLIPGGWFTMGDDQARDDERPAHAVKLNPFYMDQYEVSNREYREFQTYIDRTKDHSRCHDEEPPGSDHHPTPWYGRQPQTYFTDATFDSFPVTNITWFDAYAYAAWRGKRLPTEAEWERAARGSGKEERLYPWGNEPPRSPQEFRTNFTPTEEKPGGAGFKFTAPVDAFPKGRTPEGIFNLAGNVYEFCYDWYHGTYYQHSPQENPIGPGVQNEGKSIRGGSIDHGDDDVRTTNRQIAPSRWSYNWLGFRCVVTAAE